MLLFAMKDAFGLDSGLDDALPWLRGNQKVYNTWPKTTQPIQDKPI